MDYQVGTTDGMWHLIYYVPDLTLDDERSLLSLMEELALLMVLHQGSKFGHFSVGFLNNLLSA